MSSLTSLPSTHKYILPSLVSWRMVASRPESPKCSWIYSSLFPTRNLSYEWFVVLLFLQLFPTTGFFSLSLNHVQVSSNLKTINKTPTILQPPRAISLLLSLFLFIQTSGVISIQLCHFWLSIQSSNKYDLASAIADPQKPLIRKLSMTSSLLKPVGSWFFLTWLPWDIWHHCLLSFWNPLLYLPAGV